jgi:hypothetical protein
MRRTASDEKRAFLSKSRLIVTPPDVSSAPSSLELDERILAFIESADPNEIEFDRLALDVFAYQYVENTPYRRYCERFARRPSNVRRWAEIPAIPAAAFADVRLACFPPERATLRFVSSGTTRATRSQHELENSTLYDASLLAHFKRCVLPDANTIDVVALSPAFDDARESSLAYMLSLISRTFGTPNDGFYVKDNKLDFDGAARALREAKAPVIVAGTAFAFVHFFDRCAGEGVRFALPSGSRVIETGGFKGKSREVARDELYAWFTQPLGVPRDMCVSEYGMCELGSQWYDANLADRLAKRAPRRNLKIGPSWTRTLIVDRVTAKPVPDAEPGLLQVFDLSNRGSVAALLTGDLARRVPGGIELLGRAPGELPKGCSAAIDAALSGHAD